MTEKNTVSLGPNEWRALIVANLNHAVTFVSSGEQISVAHLKMFDDHLDRIRHFVRAWHASAPAPEAAPQAEVPVTNGAEPKRKGGWPRGKSRKNPAAAQVQ